MTSVNPFWLEKPLRSRGIAAGKKVLAAAMAFIEAEGSPTMTVAAVAKQAGTSNGSAYYVFPTRDALLQAVYRCWAADLGAVIKSVQSTGKKSLKVFLEKELLPAYCRWFKSSRHRAAFMLECETQAGAAWVLAFNDARSTMQQALLHSLRANSALEISPKETWILEPAVLGPIKLAIGAWIVSPGGSRDPEKYLSMLASAAAGALHAVYM